MLRHRRPTLLPSGGASKGVATDHETPITSMYQGQMRRLCEGSEEVSPRSGEDCPIFGSSAAIGSQARDWEPRTGKGRNLSPPRLPLLQRPSSAWFLQARLTSWFCQTRPAALIAHRLVFERMGPYARLAMPPIARGGTVPPRGGDRRRRHRERRRGLKHHSFEVKRAAATDEVRCETGPPRRATLPQRYRPVRSGLALSSHSAGPSRGPGYRFDEVAHLRSPDQRTESSIVSRGPAQQ